MCVEPWTTGEGGVGCALNTSDLGTQVIIDNSGPVSLWNVPTTSGSDGIRVETCAGKASEEWLPVQGTNAEGEPRPTTS